MGKSNKPKSNYSAQRQKQQAGGGNKWFVIGTIVVAAVILIVAVTIANLTKSDKVEDVSIVGQPVQGQEDAPVTLIEFGDFKCPSCKVFSDQILPQIQKDFIETGKAKIAFVNTTIIAQDSITAAMATESVFNQNPEAFWTYSHYLFANQPAESETWATPDNLVQMAKDAKIDVDFDLMKKDIESNKYSDDVNDDNSIAHDVGVTSTPSLLINGKRFEQVFDYPALKKAIEAEL